MPNSRHTIPVAQLEETTSSAAVPKTVRTTCPYCGVGCGVLAQVDQGRLVGVRGDPDHPANRGKLCVKGSALHETTALTGRLLSPTVGGSTVEWSEAISAVAQAIQTTRNTHGPEAVAFYVSGQLLTEDYYVANKLMKGFIGAANIDTNSRLCMSSAVVAQKRAFGGDLVPGNYEDIEAADLLLVVGANPAWTHPILYQRRMAAQQVNPEKKMVVIDPRKTVTAASADMHLAIRPGADTAFFLGLANWLVAHDCLNETFIQNYCDNFDAFLGSLRSWTLPRVASETDLNPADLEKVYDWYARTPRTVTFFSQGINQSNSGVDKGNSIINCHLMMGRVGQLGATPWSITGQPNAMGGREVGGLANQLAAHLNIENATHRRIVQDFWQSPTMAEKPGYQAVELFQKMHAGKVKCVWIMATNPLVSLPDREFVREALARCDHVIVSDVLAQTDTAAMADICLPAAAWGEKSGTVTNSERRISRQRQCVPLPGDVKPDWEILCEVGRALGWPSAFDYQHPADIFKEHAALTALLNGKPEAIRDCSQEKIVSRGLNLSGIMHLNQCDYDDLQPTQWPVLAAGKETTRLFADGKFFTTTTRAQFVAVQMRIPQQQPDLDFPFIVNSGRVRDQWHTMTRTGQSPRLACHTAEPFADFHPQDFAALHLDQKGLVRVRSPRGEVLVRPKVNKAQRRGEIFLPIHWSDCESANASVGKLFAQVVDPLSGQPELKHGVAQCEAVTPRWQAVLFTHQALPVDWLNQRGIYWSRARFGHGYKIVMAGVGQQPEGMLFFGELKKAHGEVLIEAGYAFEEIEEELIFDDCQNEHFRAGVYSAAGLQCGLWLGATLDTQTGEALSALFPQAENTPSVVSMNPAVSRAAIISQLQPTGGPIICSCLGISASQIETEIRAGCKRVEGLGEKLGCGTGCGTCVPELAALLKQGDDAPSQGLEVSAERSVLL